MGGQVRSPVEGPAARLAELGLRGKGGLAAATPPKGGEGGFAEDPGTRGASAWRGTWGSVETEDTVSQKRLTLLPGILEQGEAMALF